MQTYNERDFSAMEPAARIRWLGTQCEEFGRRLRDMVAPELVPRFRVGLEELVVTWEREHDQPCGQLDSVADLRTLRDWAVSNGKTPPVIEEFLTTHGRFSSLLEDFREGIFKPLKEAFPKHSNKKVRKAEKKLATTLKSWKDLLGEESKVKNTDLTFDMSSTGKEKTTTHRGVAFLIPALQEKAMEALRLATKWGGLLEDVVIQDVTQISDDTLGHVSMATNHNRSPKDKSVKDQPDEGNTGSNVLTKSKQGEENDELIGKNVSVSSDGSNGPKNKSAIHSILSERPRSKRESKQLKVTFGPKIPTEATTPTMSLKEKPRKEQRENVGTRLSSAKAPGRVPRLSPSTLRPLDARTPVLLVEESFLSVPKEKHTSTSLPSSPNGLLSPLTQSANMPGKHHRRSSADQPFTNNSLQSPDENKRILQKASIAKPSDGQPGASDESDAHGRVSSAKYEGDAGFRKGISDLRTEFEQIRQDALLYEYSVERERENHIKKQLMDMEEKKKEIKIKLQEEKAIMNFLTLGTNVDMARGKVVELQTELNRLNAKCVETEKRLQESSDRTMTLAAGIQLWGKNTSKTSRKLEPLDHRASRKTGSRKGTRQEGKA